MEEIKVYHSYTTGQKVSTFMLFILLLLLFLVSFGHIYMVLLPYIITDTNAESLIPSIGIFLVLLVLNLYAGIPTMFIIYFYRKEWIAHEPYCIITDKGIVINMFGQHEYPFNDIECFHIKRYLNADNSFAKTIHCPCYYNVEVCYKKDVKDTCKYNVFWTITWYIFSNLICRQFIICPQSGNNVRNAQPFCIDGKKMTSEELFCLLNNRLKASKQKV